MAVHDRDRLLEFAIPSLALFEDTAPERTLAVVAAAERQDDGKGDLSLAEVVAYVFSELRAGAAVVERVVDELEGDPEVHPVGPTGRLLGIRAPGDDGSDLARGREQLRGLGPDDVEVFVLVRLGVLGGRELHHLALRDHGRRRREDVERAQ